MKRLLTLILFLLAVPAWPGTFYGIAPGSWGTNNGPWSNASGGAATNAHPVAGDTVIFDNYSGAITTAAIAACASITQTSTSTGVLWLSSNVTVSAGCTFRNGGLTIVAAATPAFVETATAGLDPTNNVFYNFAANKSSGFGVTLANPLQTKKLEQMGSGDCTIYSNDVTVSGPMPEDAAGSWLGSQTIYWLGPGTWTCASTGGLTNLTIPAGAGACTVSGICYMYGNWTGLSAVTMTGSTVSWRASGTLTDAINTTGTNGFYNLATSNASNTLTLAQATTISGSTNVTSSSGLVLATNDLYVMGGLTTNGYLLGTGRTVHLIGTGTWTGNYTTECNLEVNTSGTITLSGQVAFGYNGNTFTYTAGTMQGDGTETLVLWGTLGSIITLHFPTTLSLQNLAFVLYTPLQTGIFTFDINKTLTIKNQLMAGGWNPITINSSSPGTQTKITCSLSGKFPVVYGVTATDIDSSGGYSILDQGGTTSNCQNWVTNKNQYFQDTGYRLFPRF